MAQVEVISGVERRRRWSADQKRVVVAAAFAPGAVVSEVARRADVRPGQIYRWRRDLGVALPGFTEVVVSPSGGEVCDPPPPAIEVAFGDGAQVRIPASASPELAAAVLQALAGR